MRLNFKPEDPDNDYMRVDLNQRDNRTLFSFVAHELSNPVSRLINGVQKTVRYVHRHFTIYARDSNGNAVHALDISTMRENNQVQLNIDLVAKERIILKQEGKYYELNINSEGMLRALPVDDVIRFNDEVRE